MSSVLETPTHDPSATHSQLQGVSRNGLHIDDSDSLYEIIDGQRVEKVMSLFANRWAAIVYFYLQRYALESKNGTPCLETLFKLPGVNRERRPDVSYITSQSWPIDRPIPRGDAWQFAPDLAIEIVSPRNYSEDVIGKVNEYFQAGSKQVWVIWPRERKFYIYLSPDAIRCLKPTDHLEGGDLLPGFRLSMAELFEAVGTEEPAS